MPDIYQDRYKPMRNRLTKINLESALAAIWAYSTHLQDDRPLPTHLRPAQGSVKDYYQLWQLAALGREVIMHCARIGGSPFTFRTFGDAMNSINDITEDLSVTAMDAGAENVMRSLDAAAHQQFPLQKQMDMPQILRYARIFGGVAINPMVQATIGFDYKQCTFFLMALMGSLMRTPCVSREQRYDEFSIPPEACLALFKWISAPAEVLSLQMKAQHVLDANWASRWNPLGTTPLVQHDPRHPERMYCPVPALLWHRIGPGMFYDLYRHKGFDNAFGAAFEAHVSEFAAYHLSTPTFTLAREQPFIHDKNRQDGADAMISDETGTLVIECKAKRMKINAKQYAPGSALREDLDVLAKAIVQLYKNTIHVREGRSLWAPRSNTLYPIVVTLEDWFLFSPTIKTDLEELVRSRLSESSLDPDLTSTMPYTVVSCDEYERMILAIEQLSVEDVMAKKVKPEYHEWMMAPYLMAQHRDALARALPNAYAPKFEQFMSNMTGLWPTAARLALDPLPT